MSGQIELASAVLNIGVNTQGLGRGILDAIKSVGGQVGAVGRDSGKQFKQGFQAETKAALDGLLAQEQKLRQQVTETRQAVVSARRAEEDATRKVEIAEAKLAEAKAKGGDSRILTAEDRLLRARRDQAAATEKSKAAEDSLNRTLAEATTVRDKIAAKTDQMASAQDRATEKTNRLRQAIEKIDWDRLGAGMKAVNWDGIARGSGVAGAAISGGLGLAARSAMTFEQSMNGVAAVSGATQGELSAMSQKALQLGKDTVFSATDASSAMEELVKAGLPVADVLGGAADATVALAAASGVDMATAATIASQAMNGFNIKAGDMGQVVDLIAGAANASAIDVDQFGQSMAQVSAVANAAGLSFDETAVAIAEMGNAGVVGSDAGTSLKTMLLNLVPSTTKAAGAMSELGIITADGSNRFYDAHGNIKSLAEIQQVLQDATKGLSQEQKTAALQTMFGTDAMRAAVVMADNGAQGYTDLSAAMGKVTAQQVAQTRMGGLAGQWEALQGSVETLSITLGTVMLPRLTQTAEQVGAVVDRFAEMSPAAQSALVTTASGMAGVLVVTAGVSKGISGVISTVESVNKVRDALAAAKVASEGLAAAQATVSATTKGGKVLDWVSAIKLGAIWTGIQTAATWAQAAAQNALNLAMKANPIGIIIGLVVAIVGAFAAAYASNERFRNSVNAVGQAIWTFVKPAFDWLSSTATVVIDGVKLAWDKLVGAFQTGQVTDTGFLGFLQILGADAKASADTISAAWQTMWTLVQPSIDQMKTALGDLKTALEQAFGPFAQWVQDTWNTQVVPAFNAFRDAVRDAADAVKTKMDEAWAALQPFAQWVQDTWNGQIVPAFNMVRDAARDAWDTVKNKAVEAWNALQPVIQPIIDKAKELWGQFQQLMAKIGELIPWQNLLMIGLGLLLLPFALVVAAVVAVIAVIGLIIFAIANFITWIANTITAVVNFATELRNRFNETRDNVAGAVDGMRQRVVDAFNGMRDGVGAAWDGIKAKVREPISAVLRFINEGIGGPYNKIADTFGVGGFRFPIVVPGYADGGVVTRDPQIRSRPVLWAEAGREAYIPLDPAKRGRSIGLWEQVGRELGALTLANGRIFPLPAGSYTQTQSVHGADGGYDYAAPIGTPVMANADAVVAQAADLGSRSYGRYVRLSNGSVYAHLQSIGVAAGQAVQAGQMIGTLGWSGNVRPPGPAGAHLHYVPGGALGAAIAGVKSAIDWVQNFVGQITAPLAGLRSKMAGFGSWGQVLTGAGSKVVDWVKAKIAAIAPSGIAGNAESWRSTVLSALSRVGQPASLADTVLRRLNQESGGNPSAINNWDVNARNGTPSKGLMQVIDPTFNAYRDTSLPNNIWDPTANIVAAFRYALARYGSLAAAFNRPGGYAGGTASATPGLHWVGERGPELLAFGGGERVYTASDSARMAGGIHIDRVEIPARDLEELRTVEDFFRRLSVEAVRG